MKKIKPRFIYSERGKKKGAMLNLKDFEILIEGLEDYEDYRTVKEFHKEKDPVLIPIEEVRARLFGKK